MSTAFATLQEQGWALPAAAAAFSNAAVAFGLATRRRAGPTARTVGSLLFAVGFALATAVIALRWLDAGRAPFKTLHESLLLFAWCVALTYLAVERFYRIAWFGLLSSAFVLLVYGYAVLGADASVMNLPPALRSPWFIPHVVVYFIGYAALFMAVMAAVLHLLRPDAVLQIETTGGGRRPLSYAGFMHLCIQLGFVLLTLGLVIGAVWAKEAWGDYWTWDPKESWALVSWLVFVIYLHLRHAQKVSERTGAVITIVGFATILFTYLGMQLLPTAAQSLHVYQ